MNKVLTFLLLLVLSACASNGPPQLPYPAFVQVDELEDIFMASLPGVRAKQLAGDAQTRRTSNRVNLPPDWKGTTGGTPGRSLEIYVLQGELVAADVTLGSGGYLYFPSGSLGFNLSSRDGAQILYFVNDADSRAVIRSPIIIDSGLLQWEATDARGVDTKMLREDPGNGSKTWLMRVSTGAALPWLSQSVIREGYLVSGNQQYSECVNGEEESWIYTPGGYYLRPPNTIHGGPEAFAYTDAVWFLRESSAGTSSSWDACVTATP